MTQFHNGARLRLERPGGGEPLTLRLSVNARARRLSVRIDARAGEAVVIAPLRKVLPGLAGLRWLSRVMRMVL